MFDIFVFDVYPNSDIVSGDIKIDIRMQPWCPRTSAIQGSNVP